MPPLTLWARKFRLFRSEAGAGAAGETRSAARGRCYVYLCAYAGEAAGDGGACFTAANGGARQAQSIDRGRARRCADVLGHFPDPLGLALLSFEAVTASDVSGRRGYIRFGAGAPRPASACFNAAHRGAREVQSSHGIRSGWASDFCGHGFSLELVKIDCLPGTLAKQPPHGKSLAAPLVVTPSRHYGYARAPR